MIKLGDYNTLTVIKAVDFGLYLDGGEVWGDILLPNEDVPERLYPGDDVKVFLYFDSEDRIVATTKHPNIVVGSFAYMRVVAVNRVGAFLDWGLRKDLLVPYREQSEPLEEGKFYMVYAYFDVKTNRIVATTKIGRYLDQTYPDYERGEEVDLIALRESDLGWNVIINNRHRGLIYRNEIFQDIRVGQRMKGYIIEVREDDKVDVSLQPLGYDKVPRLLDAIVEKIKDNGGTLDISDKSDPELIRRVFGCSKKVYKMALGALLKEGVIELLPNEVRLIQ